MNGQASAARALGIPRRTIGAWFHDPEFAEMRDRSRDDVAAAFWVGVQTALGAVIDAVTSSDASLRDKAVALGVTFDKWALLSGNATARTETRDLTGSLSDEDLVAALRGAERIVREGGAADPAPAPAEG